MPDHTPRKPRRLRSLGAYGDAKPPQYVPFCACEETELPNCVLGQELDLLLARKVFCRELRPGESFESVEGAFSLMEPDHWGYISDSDSRPWRWSIERHSMHFAVVAVRGQYSGGSKVRVQVAFNDPSQMTLCIAKASLLVCESAAVPCTES